MTGMASASGALAAPSALTIAEPVRRNVMIYDVMNSCTNYHQSYFRLLGMVLPVCLVLASPDTL